MEPRVTVITLAVEDLERAVAFYRDGLGWPTDGIIGTEFEDGAVAFFDLAGDQKLALWPRASLERDTGLRPGGTAVLAGQATPIRAFSLGHNVASKQAVDEAFERAVAVGATAVREPRSTPWGGYAAYIADPDGHLWEIAWAPDVSAG
jgi:catechol 2,3-dioxygenase-like lactoylglutathione lyase family enzyme